MNTVKAIINIKKGVIELEGPLKFVEKYLELYRPNPSKWQTVYAEKVEVSTSGEAAPRRAWTLKPKKEFTCAEKIRELCAEGYFKETRARLDVQKHLQEKKGVIFKANEVAANLKKLTSMGELQRLADGRRFMYFSKVE